MNNEIDERTDIRDQVLSARTIPEIEAARARLGNWLLAHPRDLGAAVGLGQLRRRQMAIEALDTGREKL